MVSNPVPRCSLLLVTWLWCTVSVYCTTCKAWRSLSCEVSQTDNRRSEPDKWMGDQHIRPPCYRYYTWHENLSLAGSSQQDDLVEGDGKHSMVGFCQLLWTLEAEGFVFVLSVNHSFVSLDVDFLGFWWHLVCCQGCQINCNKSNIKMLTLQQWTACACVCFWINVLLGIAFLFVL